ncbi:MAG: hypothetical protein NZL98_07345 [Anaerolineales bacterium]|nr:hypothetical protein [Anaerolineales bacterium]
MMELWTDFTFTLSLDDILRGEGADPETVRARRLALAEAAAEALRLGLPALAPAAAVQETRVLEHRHEQVILEGGKLTGPLITRHLAGAERVAAVVCTIGPALERLAAAQQNPLLMLALDGLGNAAVEAVAQQVCAQLAERAQAAGLETSTPLSPGEPEWPVEIGQSQIFTLLRPNPMGVRLTEGGMMVPMKSLSFVVGIGRQMARTNLCDLCSLKERCRYRHD